VPPKGVPQMTYSGWLHQLAGRLRTEAETPKCAALPLSGKEDKP
jgi:hypothetical protein